jgi:hypothetical protein
VENGRETSGAGGKRLTPAYTLRTLITR